MAADESIPSALQGRLRRWRAPLFIASLIYLLYLLNQSRDAILAIQSPSWLALIASLLLGLLGTLVAALAFFGLLKKYAISTTLREAFKAYLVSQVAKYIPGKIWALAYQALSLGAAFRDGAKLVGVNIEISLLAVIGTSMLVVGALWWTSGNPVYLAAFALSALVLALVPRSQFLRKLISRFGGSKLPQRDGHDANRFSLVGITMAVAGFIYHGLALPLAAFAVFGCSLQDSFLLGALSAAGWVVGTLSLVFPAGIGIRELVMVSLGYGSGLFSAELVAAFAVLSRIWMILIDVAGALLSLALKRGADSQ
ncbi:MAG: hypothetical protein ABI905_06115 [Betaproteobacteria bacterium]